MMTIPVIDADCYESNQGCYAVYGYEYKPGFVEDKAVCTFPPSPGVLGSSVDAMFSV